MVVECLIVKIIGFNLLVEVVLVDVIQVFFGACLTLCVTLSGWAFVSVTCQCIMLEGLMMLPTIWRSHLLIIYPYLSPNQIFTLLWYFHWLEYQYQSMLIFYLQSIFSIQVLVCLHAIFHDLTLYIFRW